MTEAEAANRLMRLAREYEQAEGPDLRGFIAFAATQDLVEAREGEAALESEGLDAVRLMTAHRAKGLEWRLVVIAGVQEGVWPDLRRRGSLLEADRIGRQLDRSGVRIIGSLDELQPRDVPGVDPATTDPEAELEAAVAGLAEALRQVKRIR